MRIGVLELVAFSVLLFAASVHTAAPLDRRSSTLRAWQEQAALEPHPVPLLQTDPLYDYTAIKFSSNDSVDFLATQYAKRTGWENVGRLGQLDAYRVFRQRKGGRLVRRHLEGGVRLSQGKRLVKRGLKSATISTLLGSGTKASITGAGVTVALIDDGLDYSSEDLLENFDFKGSYDFNDKTKLPTPRLVEDYHGTRCAGQIAASRNNVCGVGVAYGARVAGIRMLSKEVSDQDEVTALNYEMDTNWIYSCSWGPSDDGATVQGPDKHIEDAFINGVEKGRSGLGSIFVFATGNGGAAGDNCNFDGYTNSIYTISIGAIDHLDKHPYYSEQCSAQLAVTYSNGAQRGIVTTDLGLRSCTDKHGGTSAAAPLGAGIFALALSVRPDLTWRDVQHVAVRAALPVDTGDSDWADVAEGRRYNHKYGFGKMDAWRIVETAKTMKHVGKQTSIACPRDEANVDIPVLARQGAPSEPASRKIEITAAQVAGAKMRRIEHVTVVVDMSHDYRGNVEIWLESPHGIRSQLATVRQHDSSNQGLANWRFMSVKHWGEDPVGVWTLHVRNAYLPKHRGMLRAWQLTVFGESTDPDTRPSLPPPSSGPGPGKGDEHNPPPPAKSVEVGDKEASSMQKFYAFMVPLLLVLGSGIISALTMLVYMQRRERKLADMRWTALDAIGNSTIEEEGFRPRGGVSTGRPEDDEDTEVFEIAQTASGSSGAYKLPANEAVSLTDDDDDRTKGANSTETERLV
ncbi:pheromone processing endoprotease [Coemansia sp. RSA 2050]|nr:pheromone processing endoprotease [Coemansia sp. RSA 2050]